MTGFAGQHLAPTKQPAPAPAPAVWPPPSSLRSAGKPHPDRHPHPVNLCQCHIARGCSLRGRRHDTCSTRQLCTTREAIKARCLAGLPGSWTPGGAELAGPLDAGLQQVSCQKCPPCGTRPRRASQPLDSLAAGATPGQAGGGRTAPGTQAVPVRPGASSAHCAPARTL